MKYYLNKTLKEDFDSIEKRIHDVLQTEGFGVLSEIDVQAKMVEKLQVEFRKYKILGACNPPYAYKALQQEDKLGVLLPCNVILQELNDGEVEVAIVNPLVSMQGVNNQGLESVALEIKEKLDRVLEKI